MIHRIFSSLPTFKALEFKPGLNVLIAQKEAGASDKQTATERARPANRDRTFLDRFDPGRLLLAGGARQ